MKEARSDKLSGRFGKNPGKLSELRRQMSEFREVETEFSVWNTLRGSYTEKGLCK